MQDLFFRNITEFYLIFEDIVPSAKLISGGQSFFLFFVTTNTLRSLEWIKGRRQITKWTKKKNKENKFVAKGIIME